MINTHDILETINMIDNENLDVRTITMGISLLDCIDSNIEKACTKVYDKICGYAEHLVQTGEDISREYGIPIVNKRIAVTPIAMLAGANPAASPVHFAKALDRAARTVGVNFIGGYSALVHKGFAPGDYALIESIPEALSETEFVCSSVNIGSTKAGINMDAVKKMGSIVKEAALRTADRDCIGAAKLVVFCNAPEDNPFMAGAFHGAGEPDCVINVGVSGPGVVRAAIARPARRTTSPRSPTSSKRPRSRSRAWASSSRRRLRAVSACRSASSTFPSRRRPRSATASRTSSRRWALSSAARTARPRRSRC